MRSGKLSKLLTDYHDQEYGAPSRDESVLYERLTLETFQAGLSWEIVLKKRIGFQAAFDQFEVDKVAAFGEADIERIMNDPTVIRNRRKIEAAVFNAKAVQTLRGEFGGFAKWLDFELSQHHDDWVKSFKARFKFMGGEVVGEFLISLGLIPGAHDPDCAAGSFLHFHSWDGA